MIASPNELHYFVELTNTLNFSRASERIGISQPSLSTAIKRLEQSLGTPLFIRSKTGVTLTPSGKRLLSHTKQLMQLWDTVKSASLASHHEIQGSFTLGCHPSVGLYALAKCLPNLLQKYPKLELQLKHDVSRNILEGIINLSIDVGIIVNPIRHPDLIIQKLYDDKTTFWQAASKKISRTSTSDTVLICDPNLLQTQWLLKRAQKEGIKYSRMITSSSLEIIASLTAQECGVGILPTSVAESTTPFLTSVAKMPTYHDEIYLVYRHENREIKAMQTITQAIKNSLIK